ncbi:ubiquitin fusion degradation protein [Entomortierella beljakovae]|nr:ubiquitin fusion degradation protein [Entomortierella beljakovae]
METKPVGVGISIVETDLEVDFAPPVGYQEPTPTPRSRPIMESKLRKEVEKRIATPEGNRKSPFDGQGQRLSGTTGKNKSVAKESIPIQVPEISPDKGKSGDVLDKNGSEAPAALNLPLGHLYFGYTHIPPKTDEEKQKAAEKVKQEPVFEGTGQTLRPPRKNAPRGSGTNSPSPAGK